MIINRRQFVITATVASTALASSSKPYSNPPKLKRAGVKPIVISSANGNKYKNGGNQTCVERAFKMMSGGMDVLDSLLAGVNINELDPDEDSVGYGGLPNSDGIIQLDASCMHGPRRRAGAVAALEGVPTPSLVARAVMNETDNHLLVGKGAQDFARRMGFKIEDDLNTEHSRRLWLEWKRRTDPDHYTGPKSLTDVAERVGQQMIAEGLIDPAHYYGTINCNGINSRGEICGVTTTSGQAWKIPGRVGDSPILGAGLYVDNEVGAAGSTGRGETNLFNLNSFLIVENMRSGMHPMEAALSACRRIKATTVEKRLLTELGEPNFQITFYALSVKGEYAGVSMYEGEHFAVCTENGAETIACAHLLKGNPPGRNLERKVAG